MALNPDALITLDDARDYVKEQSQRNDAVLEGLINGLSQTFQNRSTSVLAQREVTNYRANGNGKNYILTPLTPLIEISQIAINYDFDDSNYVTLTDPDTDWVIRDFETGHVLLINNFFLVGRKNVLFDMTVGLQAPTLAKWQRLLRLQLQYEYQRWQNKEGGVISRSLSDGSIHFNPPQNLLKEVEDGIEQANEGYRFH